MSDYENGKIYVYDAASQTFDQAPENLAAEALAHMLAIPLGRAVHFLNEFHVSHKGSDNPAHCNNT